MPILVRRINRAKWGQNCNENDLEDSSADAITNCLKTNNNDLSVWRIESIDQLENALLALITSKQQSKLSTLHYVLIDEELLKANDLNLSETPGDTVIESLKDSHRDINNLTYSRLGKMKNIILNCLNEDDKYNFITKSKLKAFLKKAIADGKIQRDILNSDLIENERL
ncbi:hypothetical protein H4K35_11805 [Myroides sp. NP-2]|uniref:hypothetical protein n=1 Tax=Myroides sp. NP-2 TaxID=2759945 RepID=UPI0015F87A9D|nr:hypothetical protein [Myroides sp. NP-2]MBB1150791.1 hypothetical protein [Myroides sp. NP-2]